MKGLQKTPHKKITPQTPIQEAQGKKLYIVKKNNQKVTIELGWKQFHPSASEAKEKALNSPQKAIIYIPGWGYDEQSQTVAKTCQMLADTLGLITYAVDTFARERPYASLVEEAEADRLFLTEKGITEIILLGFSQGGVQATHLAKNNLTVKLLVLINSTGLYRQSLFRISVNFTIAAFREMLLTRTSSWTEEHELARRERYTYLRQHIARSGGTLQYFSPLRGRGKSEFLDQIPLNPSSKKVSAPVLVILGKHDPIVQLKRVVPITLKEKITEECMKQHLQTIFSTSPYVKTLIIPTGHDILTKNIHNITNAIDNFHK